MSTDDRQARLEALKAEKSKTQDLLSQMGHFTGPEPDHHRKTLQAALDYMGREIRKLEGNTK